MKKIVYRFIMAFVIMTALGCSSFAKGVQPQGSSSRIVIYTSMYEYVIQSVKRELKKQFPEYSIDFVYGGTGNIQAMVATEQESGGRLGCDMLMVAEPGYSIELKQKGLLEAYKSPHIPAMNFDYDPDGYWYPVRVSNMVLAYNPDKYNKSDLPNSFYGFAYDQSLRNAISMRNPLTSGTSMAAVTALRDKYGYDYFDALSKQNIRIEYDTESQLRKLEYGAYKEIMVLEESILRARQDGSKLEVIYPTDGTIMIPSTIMIINAKWSANNNIAAAKAITDWFLSEKGQNSIVDGWMHSVRAYFPRIPYDSKPTGEIRMNSISVNWDHYFNQKHEIQDRFQDYLAQRESN